MDIDGAGPSTYKKRKMMFEETNVLKKEDLSSLEASDDELFSEDDNNFDSEFENTDNDNEGVYTPNWSNDPKDMKIFQFSRASQLLQAIPDNSKPIDYFRAIFDDKILELIVNETNQYAEELFMSEGVSEKSRITRWKPVTSAEMLTFVALVLHTGTIRLNRLQDYWKSHPLFNLTCFSKYMSRDRFLLIMRCLHFAKSQPEPKVPKYPLYKIRPIVDFFNNKMSLIYCPGKSLSIDEPMVLRRGQVMFHHEIRNKRCKNDIKLYMLTEANSVILKSLIVYPRAIYDSGEKLCTLKVVLDLLENYLDLAHSVYLDNSYTSLELANKLTSRNTYCTGILNPKRTNNPKQVVAKKLKRGETVAAYFNDIMVGKWRNIGEVLYISNEYGNQMTKYVDHQNRTKQKPNPILYYDKYMNRADHQDLLNSYYPCDRNTLSWYKKLGIHFIQLMLINSYFLYKKFVRQNTSFYEFRISVLEELLHVEVTRTLKARDPKKHVLSKITAVNGKGGTNRKRCRVCSQKKIRKLTLYHCEKCPQQPGLCVGECFETFHA